MSTVDATLQPKPNMNAPVIKPMHQESAFLGDMLSDAIRETSGAPACEMHQALRQAAIARRLGQPDAGRELQNLVSGLDQDQIRIAIRALTVSLDLLNLVEDRQRVQVLIERARQAYPEPRLESIGSAISQLKSNGMSVESIQSLIDQLRIELVFTAYPTEAKRRSVRSKVRAIRELMNRYSRSRMPQDRDVIGEKIRAKVMKLWQTDFIRPWRPSVMQEVARGLSMKPVLWDDITVTRSP